MFSRKVGESGRSAEGRLERRFVRVPAGGAGRRGGTPRIVGRRARAGRPTGASAAAVTAAATTTAVGPLSAVDLRRGVPQRRTDLIDLELDDGALLAFLGLERPLLEPPGNDHPGAAGQRFGHVLGRLTPDVAAQEQRFAVLPFARCPVEGPRG